MAVFPWMLEMGNMFVKDTKSAEPNVEKLNSEDSVLSHVQTLEDWYSAEFERRLAELSQILNAELEARVAEFRAQYEARCRALEEKSAQASRPAQLQVQPPVSPQIVRPSPQGHPEGLVAEIRRSEDLAQKCASELERMVSDDSVALGKLLQMRNQELELKAYIRGLKFCADVVATASPSADAPE